VPRFRSRIPINSSGEQKAKSIHLSGVSLLMNPCTSTNLSTWSNGRFLVRRTSLLYAAGLAESGYRDCPLEAMAFDHQRRFDAGDPPYLIEAQARAQTLALKPTI
jgi:hypothetical protein